MAQQQEDEAEPEPETNDLELDIKKANSKDTKDQNFRELNDKEVAGNVEEEEEKERNTDEEELGHLEDSADSGGLNRNVNLNTKASNISVLPYKHLLLAAMNQPDKT